MTTDRITFNCMKCGHVVSVDKDNMPNEQDILSCMGCGVEFGLYSEVKQAMVDAGKAEVDRITQNALGVKPTWTSHPDSQDGD